MANVAAFHSQQAAEKLLKALISTSSIEPPRVHDLAELSDVATKARPDVQPLAEKIESITSWAVLTRYPSHGDTVPPAPAGSWRRIRRPKKASFCAAWCAEIRARAQHSAQN